MFKIRYLENFELDIAYELYCNCFNKEKKKITIPLKGIILGAFIDNELIGIAQIDSINNIFENTKIFYINSICIKENYRNNGYGKKLLQECINTIKTKGGNLINLTANKNRVYAHMMYKSLGFEEANTILFKKDI